MNCFRSIFSILFIINKYKYN